MKAGQARRHIAPYAAHAGGLSWQQNRAPVYSRGPLNSSWRMAGYEEGRGGVGLKHIPYAVRKSLIYQPLKFHGFYTSDPPALSPCPWRLATFQLYTTDDRSLVLSINQELTKMILYYSNKVKQKKPNKNKKTPHEAKGVVSYQDFFFLL